MTTPDVVHDVVLLTFMRPVDRNGMRAYGRATLVDNTWVDVPVEQVLRRLASTPGQLDDVPGAQLTVQTVLQGGLHRGTRSLSTLHRAVKDTLLAHDIDATDDLVTAVLGAVSQSVAFEPEPLANDEVAIVVGDLVGYRTDDGVIPWTVTKVRSGKATVDLVRGHGRRRQNRSKVPIADLAWHRPDAVDARRPT